MNAFLVRSSLAALLVALLAPGLGAEPAPSPTPPFAEAFRKADADGDGKLSSDEAKKGGFFTRHAFTSADADADGSVTLFELGKAVTQSSKDWVADHDAADANQDGYVDEKEASLSSRLSAVFSNADKNKDGRLDRDEVMGEVMHGYYSETATQPLVPNIIDEKF